MAKAKKKTAYQKAKEAAKTAARGVEILTGTGKPPGWRKKPKTAKKKVMKVANNKKY
jgi:hypothetical protein